MRPAGALVLTALAAATACRFDQGFDGTGYRCGEGERCPEGQTCVAGVCALTGDGPVGDGDGGGDGPDANPDAPPATVVCGNLSLLHDSFDNTMPRPYFDSWADPGTAVSESGGAVVVDVMAGASDGYAGYDSFYFYDLHGGGLEAEVAEVAGNGVSTILEVQNHAGNVAQLMVENGSAFAALYNVPSPGQVAQRPWTVAERYWRIREDGGDMVWELSTDRQTWSELHRRPLPFDVAHVRGTISAGGSPATTTRARFAAINPSPSPATFCPADQLHDDFAAPPLWPQWAQYTNQGCTIAETGGALVMTFTGTGTNGFCGMDTTHLWDISRGDGLVVDGNAFPSLGNVVSYLQAAQVGSGGDTRIEITLDNTALEARSYLAGAEVAARSVTNSRTTHRWWRLRGEGNQMVAETSPDRVTWNELLRSTVSWSLAEVEINLGSGHYGNVTGGAYTVTVPGINAD